MSTDGLWNIYAFSRVCFFGLLIGVIASLIAMNTTDDKEKAAERKQLMLYLAKALGIAFLVMAITLFLYEQSFVGLEELQGNY